MYLQMNIPQKPDKMFDEDRKITNPKEVYELAEIQAIKGAVQEHMIFIGLNNANIINNISVLGIGKSNCAFLEIKEIVRMALISASNKVILVHNHPSNSLKPSEFDIQLTNTASKLLKAFNLQLLDHIIVTEKDFMSLEKEINKNIENEQTNLMNIAFLEQENYKLKYKIELLESKLQEYEEQSEFE